MLIRRGSVYHHSEGDTTVSGDTSIQLCPKCYKRGLTVSAPGAGGSSGGAAGGADDDDGDESDEDVSHTAMAEIDKSTVASRNRVQVTQVSDPSQYEQLRWDPDWGEPEPWVQCACCLEVVHHVCGMYDPKATNKAFVCEFCRLASDNEPTDVLGDGPEPSPTELGALRVDHTRAIPKAKGHITVQGQGRARGRGKGKAVAGASGSQRTSPRQAEKTKGLTPYSVPVPGTPSLPWPWPVPDAAEQRYDAWSLPETSMGAYIEGRIKTELRQVCAPTPNSCFRCGVRVVNVYC
jgi:hypothetical protein